MSIVDCPHIVLRGRDVVCVNCGATEKVLPCNIDKVGRSCSAFVDKHRSCPNVEDLKRKLAEHVEVLTEACRQRDEAVESARMWARRVEATNYVALERRHDQLTEASAKCLKQRNDEIETSLGFRKRALRAEKAIANARRWLRVKQLGKAYAALDWKVR